MVCAFKSLSGNADQMPSRLDERALDSLITEQRRWWPEIQGLMRDAARPLIRVEAARYVLSRSSVWQENDPRDSETRSAVLMLASEVALVLDPELGMKPNHRLIMASQEYRDNLVVALNPSSKHLGEAARAALREANQNANAFPIPQPAVSNKIRIAELAQAAPEPLSQSESPAMTANASSTAQITVGAVEPEPPRLSQHYFWITGGILVLAVLAWRVWKKPRQD